MRELTLRQAKTAIAGLVVLGPASLLSAADPADGQRYLAAVRRFADVVIEKGRDTYGPEKTPLFVDGLHVESFAPVRWNNKGQTWVLCNFANQQALMRTLDGLTALTGESGYRQAAQNAARHALQRLVTPNGLLAWGGHLAWDLDGERAVGEGGPYTHELKTSQPYYELMWRVDPAATRRVLEAVWGGHVLDWALLDFNRHADVRKPAVPRWDADFNESVDVPFPSVANNLSFVNVTPPLMHTGVMLGILGQSEPALKWTRRLVRRWQQGRDPKTGLCGGQLSYRKDDRAHEALGHVHPEINEAKIVASYHQTCRYHQLPLAQMQSGQDLLAAGGAHATLGHEFIQWACDDLKVYAQRCYDAEKGVFIARMTDGTAIRWQESRKGYYVPESFAPQQPSGMLLWSFATAYRLGNDRAHWRMAREMGRKLGLGDIGPPRGPRQSALDTHLADVHALYGLLELHRATRDEALLKLACRVGDNLLATQAPSGLFPRKGSVYARTGDEIPLVLLHLAGAVAGKTDTLPAPRLDHAFFHCVYDGELNEAQQKRDDARTVDNLVFYNARE
ncbi:MAG: hypothetical protein AMXMBFR83_14440 [Phycisphaerae bacterium]